MERSRVISIVAGLALSLVSWISPARAVDVRYTVTDLSAILESSFAEPEKVTYCSVMAINNHGQVAGYAETTDNSIFAFVWDEVNGLRDLSHLEGGNWTFAINNLGQVAVGAYPPYVWDSGTGLQEIAGLGSGPIWIRDINDSGAVVGAYTNADLWQAFVWQDGIKRNLGTLGGQEADAWAINDLGQIVGWSDTADSSHAFLWDAENGMRDLGSLGRGSIASDINNVGQVVGYSGTGTHGQRAFLWEAGAMTCIDTLGGEASTAASINDRGEVVGTWQLPEYEDASAFLWTKVDGAIDLNQLIESDGEWKIVGAIAINEDGWIVGTARKNLGAGYSEAREVLLRPVPEPTTFVFLIGGFGIALTSHVASYVLKARQQ